MSEQELSKTLTRYFREPTVNHSNLETLFTLVSQFAIKLQQHKFIQKVNSVSDHLLTKDNAKTIIKRYFHVVNEVLEKDDKLKPQHRYKAVISNQIVSQFIIFLTKVLRFGNMDLFVDIKMWRKKLAKKILDKAYDSMRAEALKQLKVDLDKGFSEEQVSTLEKGYRKRDMSSSDIQKYLNGLVVSKDQNSEREKAKNKSQQNKQKRAEREKEREKQRRKEQSQNQEEGSSEDQEQQEAEGRARKRVKRDYDQKTELTADKKKYEHMKTDIASQPSPQYPPSTSASPSFPFDHRRPVEPIQPSWQYSNSYYQPQVHQQQQQYPQSQYPPTQYQNTYSGDPRYPYYYPQQQQQQQQYPSQFYPILQQSRENRQTQQKYSNKIIQRLMSCKNLYFHQCKCCGMLLTTTQKYENHMSRHFQNSQKNYEQSHSKIEHSRKLTKPLMQTSDQWMQSNKMISSNQKYIVPLSSVQEMSMSEVECLICRGEIKVQWNGGDLQCWVYQDAVRGKRMGQIGVCHLECWRVAEEFESDGKG